MKYPGNPGRRGSNDRTENLNKYVFDSGFANDRIGLIKSYSAPGTTWSTEKSPSSPFEEK